MFFTPRKQIIILRTVHWQRLMETCVKNTLLKSLFLRSHVDLFKLGPRKLFLIVKLHLFNKSKVFIFICHRSKNPKVKGQCHMVDAVFLALYFYIIILTNSVMITYSKCKGIPDTAHDNDNDLNHFKSALVGSKRQLTGWKPLKEILNCDCCRAFPYMETHSQNTQNRGSTFWVPGTKSLKKERDWEREREREQCVPDYKCSLHCPTKRHIHPTINGHEEDWSRAGRVLENVKRGLQAVYLSSVGAH